jgi:parallel beta-helix repeat protein
MDKRYGILIISITILVMSFVGTASAMTWTVDDDGGADFTGIQEAINNASDGDTIIVHSGVYYENVIVNKSVTLKGIGQPVVDARGKGDAITLTADGITVEEFSATNCSWWGGGIKIISSNNTITGNNVSNNEEGIYLDDSSSNNTITGNNASINVFGIRLHSSSNNVITGNNASSNWCGISLYSSSNNTIAGNNVRNNYWKDTYRNSRGRLQGISLVYFCNNNTITGNNVSNNDDGIGLSYFSNNNTITGNNVSNNNDYGIVLSSSRSNTITYNTFLNEGLSVDYSYQNTVENNTVNDKPLVYLEDASDYRVEDAGQVILVNCTNITVENLDLSHSSVGIKLLNTKDSKVLNNTVSNNIISIDLSSSSNNTITGNNASNNSYHGISLSYSSKNTITGNNVCNNSMSGISLSLSSNNGIICNNSCSNNVVGIGLSSSNNTITGNNVCNNNWDGISLDRSSNNTITGNTFVTDGIFVKASYQNIVEDNTVNGKPLIYLEDASDYKVEDAGQIILVNCNNITLENLDLSYTSVGIELWMTKDSKMLNNTVRSNNRHGIYLSYSGNNRITGNNVSKNNCGIGFYDSWSNNHLYLNNLVNNSDNVNTVNVYGRRSTNIWKSTEKITYFYLGTTYESYLGNYWDDYDGTDTDGDGIGDTPYSIDPKNEESDAYPLMQPFENYIT